MYTTEGDLTGKHGQQLDGFGDATGGGDLPDKISPRQKRLAHATSLRTKKPRTGVVGKHGTWGRAKTNEIPEIPHEGEDDDVEGDPRNVAPSGEVISMKAKHS